jgi:hypothetical protein
LATLIVPSRSACGSIRRHLRQTVEFTLPIANSTLQCAHSVRHFTTTGQMQDDLGLRSNNGMECADI